MSKYVRNVCGASGDFVSMKTTLHLLILLTLTVLTGGCASHVGVSTPHHHVGVGAAVR